MKPFLSRPEVPITISVILVLVGLFCAPSGHKEVTKDVVPDAAPPLPVATQPSSSVPEQASSTPSPAESAPPSTPDTGEGADGGSGETGATPTTRRGFAAAKALFDSGNYAEALPKLDALAAT